MENILGFNHYGRFQHEIEIVNCGHYFGSDWGDCYRGGKEIGAKMTIETQVETEPGMNSQSSLQKELNKHEELGKTEKMGGSNIYRLEASEEFKKEVDSLLRDIPGIILPN